jgi:tetratricopeptide (TPR) repeat protein
MKNAISILFLFIFIGAIHAQDDFNDRWNAAYALADEGNYDLALVAFEPLLNEQPLEPATHIQVAWCNMLTGRMEKAIEHAMTAYQLDMLNSGSNLVMSYVRSADNKPYADVFLKEAFWLMTDDQAIADVNLDLEEMEANNLSTEKLREELKNMNETLASRDRSWTTIYQNFSDGVTVMNEDAVTASDKFIASLNGFEGLDKEWAKYHTAYAIGTYYYNVDDTSQYPALFESALVWMVENKKTNYLPIVQMSGLLGEFYYSIGDYQRSVDVLEIGLEPYPIFSRFTYLKQYLAIYVNQYALSTLAIGAWEDARAMGTVLSTLSGTPYDEWYQTKGLIYVGDAWIKEDKIKANEYYQKAFDLAEESGFEELQLDIKERWADNY